MAIVAFGELTSGLAHPDLIVGQEAQMSQRRWQVQAPCIDPVHRARRHADGVVMCGVVGAQQGWQDVHETLRPVDCHLAMNHALQSPLEAFNVVYEEVYVPRLEQLLEGCCMHFGALVDLHGQRRLIFHLIQNGLHGNRRHAQGY